MKGIVSFYEKPECKSNAAQKELLSNAGYTIQAINILEKEWDIDSLTCFFGNKTVHECLNLKAPLINSNELDTTLLSEEQLLNKMIEAPILIKRPLIFYRGEYGCGFDSPLVTKLLGTPQKESGCFKTT